MRNSSGFKWRGTISMDKYISLAHPYDSYRPFVGEPSAVPPSSRAYASFGAPAVNRPVIAPSGIESSSMNAGNVGAAINSAASAISPLMPALDAFLSPGISKVQGDYSTETLANTAVITLEYYEVDDINEVGRIFESNGYAVTQYITTSPFSIHNRQMYDYIQCDEVNVTGTIDGMALEDIKSRLASGIRMWHTNSRGELICEQAPFNISMGQLCVKDNTEV